VLLNWNNIMSKKTDDMDAFKKLMDQVVVPKTPLPGAKVAMTKPVPKPAVSKAMQNKLRLEQLKKANQARMDRVRKQQLNLQKMVSALTQTNAAIRDTLSSKAGASKKTTKGFSR
jgi:hypothetical protein